MSLCAGGSGGGRPPRVVRTAVIQHAMPKSATSPVGEQRAAVFERVGTMVEMAGKLGAQIVCLQEAWSMPFAFCTREKEWAGAFAESAEEGESIKICQQWARKFNAVIISPILERDETHGDTIWNTAVVIGYVSLVHAFSIEHPPLPSTALANSLCKIGI